MGDDTSISSATGGRAGLSLPFSQQPLQLVKRTEDASIRLAKTLLKSSTMQKECYKCPDCGSYCGKNWFTRPYYSKALTYEQEKEIALVAEVKPDSDVK